MARSHEWGMTYAVAWKDRLVSSTAKAGLKLRSLRKLKLGERLATLREPGATVVRGVLACVRAMTEERSLRRGVKKLR